MSVCVSSKFTYAGITLRGRKRKRAGEGTSLHRGDGGRIEELGVAADLAHHGSHRGICASGRKEVQAIGGGGGGGGACICALLRMCVLWGHGLGGRRVE